MPRPAALAAVAGILFIGSVNTGSWRPVAQAETTATTATSEATGPRGPRGFTGPRGPRGFRGYNGLNGWNGEPGPTGPQGATGPQGTQGAQGSQGAPGAQGAQGTQGTQGAQGLNGPAGAQGAQGPEGPTGPQGIQGVPGAQGPAGEAGPAAQPWVPAVGSFYDTTTQVLIAANSAQPMTLNQATDGAGGVIARGVSVAAPGRITVAEAGVYNIQFSAQLDKTDAGTDQVDIWLAINGQNNPVPWTNTSVAVSTTLKSVAAWNFVIALQANDFVQIMWSSPDANMRLFSQPAATNPTRPGIPSVIVTVIQVG